ncbi:hypothetical protein IJ579_04255 [bacterium]|nr:hypothetical protein [bacterium]
MYIVLSSAIIINLLSVVILLIGLFYNFKQPKNKAAYGYLIIGCMLLYIIALSLVLIYGFFAKHFLNSLVLFLCIISHFIIGKLVKYETLKKYTTVQIMCYIVSLITLLSF